MSRIRDERRNRVEVMQKFDRLYRRLYLPTRKARSPSCSRCFPHRRCCCRCSCLFHGCCWSRRYFLEHCSYLSDRPNVDCSVVSIANPFVLVIGQDLVPLTLSRTTTVVRYYFRLTKLCAGVSFHTEFCRLALGYTFTIDDSRHQ